MQSVLIKHVIKQEWGLISMCVHACVCVCMCVCSQIRPQEMSEGCFWVLADEDRYAKPDLLSRLADAFGSQRPG